MLTGKLPYTGESPVTVALKHISDPVPAIDLRTTGVSPALASIVNRLLQKKPQNRFQSASELASALREARERPNIPGYRISDDAPHARGDRRENRLPPRRSPLPDRPYVFDETETERRRRSPWTIAALAVALLAATALGYVLFTRPLSQLAGGVVVGDYTGMTVAQAQEAVVNAGLRTRFTKGASETIAADHVIRQNPPAGTNVEKNQVVELFISTGKPLRGLDDVRGFSVDDAQRALQQDGFAVNIAYRFDNTVKNNVIDQLPKPGAKVPEGSRVTLIVSNGPRPVLIPNFVNMPVPAARALANRLGITLDTSQSVPGNPANTIASQDIPQGTQVDRNAIVRVVVNGGLPNAAPPTPEPNGPLASLPSVVDQDYASAEKSLTQAGFQVSLRYATQSTNNGTIVAQDPPAGQVAQGSSVTITLSVSGEVPDTDGLTRQSALQTLEADGYSVSKWQYTTSVGTEGKVVGTQPSAGTPLSPGSAVTVIVNGTPAP